MWTLSTSGSSSRCEKWPSLRAQKTRVGRLFIENENCAAILPHNNFAVLSNKCESARVLSLSLSLSHTRSPLCTVPLVLFDWTSAPTPSETRHITHAKHHVYSCYLVHYSTEWTFIVFHPSTRVSRSQRQTRRSTESRVSFHLYHSGERLTERERGRGREREVWGVRGRDVQNVNCLSHCFLRKSILLTDDVTENRMACDTVTTRWRVYWTVGRPWSDRRCS